MILRQNVLLKDFSTYKIGGPARYFCEIYSEDDLQEAVKFAKDKHLQIFVLGGGSNLIISDDGFDGLVVKVNDLRFTIYDLRIDVGAGFDLPTLVEKTTKAGLAGLEWAGGLPGTVGGAVFGNAGCFGHEIREIIRSVTAAKINNYKLQATSYKLRECEFSYRNSKFKREGGWIILSCVLQFQQGDADALQKMAQEKIDYRKSRHPLEYPNIGSIFKNIDERGKIEAILKRLPELEEQVRRKWYGKIPTAVLIEKAGLAGKQIGGAEVSQKHANFIINKDTAKAQDVISLVQEIKNRIKMLFDINLQEEVRYVGL